MRHATGGLTGKPGLVLIVTLLLALALGAVGGYRPGIILALMLCQFYCLMIDRDMGVIESLEASRTLMRGNKLTLFAVWLVCGIVGGLAVVLTCFLGAFFVVPFLSLMIPVVYLMASGQPMAPEARLR